MKMNNARRLYHLNHFQVTPDQLRERENLERTVLLETHGMCAEILERLEKLESKPQERSLFEQVFGKF